MSKTEYVPQPWRMKGYYPDQYAKSMAALGIGMDYDDDDYDRYQAEFLADLDAHDARIASEAAEGALRDAADACGSSKTNWTKAWLNARAERLASEREAGDER